VASINQLHGCSQPRKQMTQRSKDSYSQVFPTGLYLSCMCARYH